MKELVSTLNGAISVMLNEQNGKYVLYVHGEEFYSKDSKSAMRKALHCSYLFGDCMCEKYQRACVEMEKNF